MAWTTTPRDSSSCATLSPELVVPERGEEVRLVGEQGELHGGDAAPSARLLPLVDRVRDLARGRDAVDAREPDPLDVPDDGDVHADIVSSSAVRAPISRRSHDCAVPAFHWMMDAVATIPPFETFYDEHAGEVLRLLRRRLGRERADDAFQETFLRALGPTTGSAMASISAPGC